MRENSRQLLEQTAINLEDYLRSMRRISDAMYYSVIKDKDLEQEGMDEEMTLLYEANKDNLVSIACYTYDGGLVEATPVANEKRVDSRIAGLVCRREESAGKFSFFDTACTESV